MIHRPTRGLDTLVRDWAAVVPFLIGIAWLLIGPALNLVADSLRDPQGGVTLLNWRDVIGNPLTRRAIVTSMTVGLAVATLTAAVGVPLGWCIGRLRVGGRSVAIAALNVAANLPATSLVFGFAAAFGGGGMITLALRLLWPEAPELDLYSLPGLVAVYFYFHMPLFVLLILPAMGAVSDELWEAASVCGAGRVRFWVRVGLPVLAPFALAGWILMFVSAIGQYGVPLALGGSEGAVNLVTLRIGDLIQFVGSSNRFERAACLSLLLILVSVGALWMYRSLLGRAMRWLA